MAAAVTRCSRELGGITMSEGALDFDESRPAPDPRCERRGEAPSLRIQFVDCSPYRSQRNLAVQGGVCRLPLGCSNGWEENGGLAIRVAKALLHNTMSGEVKNAAVGAVKLFYLDDYDDDLRQDLEHYVLR